MVKSTIWLVLQPLRTGYDGRVVGIEVDRILKTKPGKLGVRDIAVQVNIEVDEALFTVPQPVVTLHLDDQRQMVVPELDVPNQPQPEDGEEVDTTLDVD